MEQEKGVPSHIQDFLEVQHNASYLYLLEENLVIGILPTTKEAVIYDFYFRWSCA